MTRELTHTGSDSQALSPTHASNDNVCIWLVIMPEKLPPILNPRLINQINKYSQAKQAQS